MLKTITLKNFVHFKDETVIHLDANKKESDGCNSLNVFVGANFCGKSTIIELIRRCMTDEINLSKTSLCLEDSVAYAFCKFDDEIISGIIAEPYPNHYHSPTVYKFFIYDKVNDKENETFFRFKSSNNSAHFYTDVLGDTEKKVFRKLLGKKTGETSQTDENINYLLKMIKTKKMTNFSQYKPSWKDIENQFIATFPLRGIGIAQWSKSERIQNERNYIEACERAEVISTLLRTKQFDEEYEKEIFEFITYPDVFTFTQNNGHIYVQKDELKFHLLKTSEGIIEAKLTCLLLADTSIKTLCLEEPDRGMHPQMIERLKTVLCKAAYNKTIIVVTHSPIFIDNITIHNTHVFFRKKIITNCKISPLKKIKSFPELSKVSDNEKLHQSALFTSKQITDAKNCSDKRSRCCLDIMKSTESNTCSLKKVKSCPELSKVDSFEKFQCMLEIRKFMSDSDTSLRKIKSCPELSIMSDSEKLHRSLLFTRNQIIFFNNCSVKRNGSCSEPSKVRSFKKILRMLEIRKLISDYLEFSKMYDKEKSQRKRITDYKVCCLEKVRSSPKLSKVTDIEIIRSVLFANKVLLVEGATDREVVQGIFTEYKSDKLRRGEKKIGEFKKDITTYQVVSVDGYKNVKRVREFCEYIHLPCLCLMDLDTIVHSKKLKSSKQNQAKKTKLISKFSIGKQKYWEKYIFENISSFVAHSDSMKAAKSLESKENTFIWRHGAVEDAILSSPILKEEIATTLRLNCKQLTPDRLKSKLKERLTVEQGKTFYSKVLNVEEIRRFIQFIERKEECLTVYDSYRKRNMSESKSYNSFF
ncbi:uncharacterized protein LOC128192386 [Crassostrea angulata]|uniref:uncharacterized protein LOC128192386 n=1 Tax=Magallana angulata TaxID=2784310 RepID=UPI0022B19EE4|nr:uncharacterized protein LOC128192386 [Crassostrea angulata]